MTLLETKRFLIHPIRADNPTHRTLYLHLYTDPAVMHRILPPMDAGVAEHAFERACEFTAGDRPGHRYWIISDKTSGDAIGLAGFRCSGAEAEIGVMLREVWWNRGVSSETFVALIDHAFGPMGLERVTAERPDDDHAQLIDRLLDRFGFRREPARASAPGLCRWELPRQRWTGLPAG